MCLNPAAERGMVLRKQQGRIQAAEMDKGTAPEGTMVKEELEAGAIPRDPKAAVKDMPTQSGSR
jgi:hypothetical protein